MAEVKRCIECSGKYIDSGEGCPHCKGLKEVPKKVVKK